MNNTILSRKPYCHSFLWIAAILHLEAHQKTLTPTCEKQTMGADRLLCPRRHPHLHLYLPSLLPAQKEVQTLWWLQLAVLEDWRHLRAPCDRWFLKQGGHGAPKEQILADKHRALQLCRPSRLWCYPWPLQEHHENKTAEGEARFQEKLGWA